MNKPTALMLVAAASLRKGFRIGWRGMLLAAVVLVLAAPRARAATDMVTTTSNDASVTGSLPYWIASASAGDTIQFSSSLDGQTITVASTLSITQSLTIQGPGASLLTISGGNAVQVFTINSNSTVSISGLTIANGNSGVPYGGGIENYGTLSVANCAFTGNTALYFGGAIFNYGTLTVTNSTFSGNTVPSGNGQGGAISNFDNGTQLTVTNSTFTGNSASVGGGAIAPYGLLALTGSTFSGNSAQYGGGIFIPSSTTVTVTNSTFSGNSAHYGGGIYNADQVTVRSSTFSGNSASSGGGGIFGFDDSGLTVTNSLLTNDTGGECSNSGGGACPSDGSGGNVVGVSANLAPLGNYGGPTQTLLPLPGSAAMCMGSASLIPGGVITDQRGFPRVNTSYPGYSSNSPCLDAGAVQTDYQSAQFTEASYSAPPNIPVSSPDVVVSVTENGQNLGGVPVTLVFSGTGTASGLGPETTIAGTGADFSSLSVSALGTDTLSVTLPYLGSNTLTASAGLEITNSTSSPAVTVTKSVTSTGPYNAVGQTISYSFVAKNTGNVALSAVRVIDTQTAPAGALTSGPTCQSLSSPAGSCSGSSTTLAAGQSATFTGTYTLTQADLNNGSVNDSATASGTPPTGSAVSSLPSTATVTTTSSPAVTVTKSVTSTGPYNAVGQTISYSFVARNTGNVTLTSVGVTDSQTAPAGALISSPACQSLGSPTGSCSGSTTALLPGQSATFTGSYTLTQADLNNGSVNDSATASGTPPTGSAVTSPPSTATVNTTSTPAVTVTKSVVSTGPYNAVGQTISYLFVAKNTGNVTLSAVGVTDTQTAPAGALTTSPECESLSSPTGSCSGSATTLLPGQSASFKGIYTLTQADLNNGSVSDSATASGTPPTGSAVSSLPSTATVTTTSTPAVTVTKSVTSTGPYNGVGQTISYQFVAKNTGNVTLTSVGVTDTQTAPAGALTSGPSCQSLNSPVGICSGPTTTLLPGQSATFTGTYTLTQADLDSGSVRDTATASGAPPAGAPVTSPLSTVTVTTTSTPAVSLLKSANLSSYSASGVPITYSFKVTNTGNVTLNAVTVTDPHAGLSVVTCPSNSLAPLAFETCTAAYITTQADIIAGSISNTATASGTPPTGPAVTSQPSSVAIPVGTVNVSVGTNLTGPTISVDNGAPFTGANNFTWTIGTQHTIATLSPQAGPAGTQYVWSNWSDGGQISHTLTATTTTTTFTANFVTQYLLNTAANPASGGTVTPAAGSFDNASSVVNLTASPAPGYIFSSWTGPVASASSASTTVTMNAAESVTANFLPTLTITASSAPMTYGGTVPAITPIYSPPSPAVTGVTCSTLATSSSPVGTYTSSCTGAVGDYAITYATGLVTVTKATPAFSGLSSPSIAYGTASTVISGTLNANANGQLIPSFESVSIAINGVTQTAALNGSDQFSTSFATGTLAAGSYSIAFSYGGDPNFSTAIAGGTLTINQANQATLSFTAPSSITYGSTGTAMATGGSGTGALSFSAGTSTGCVVAGTTVTVTNASGTCLLTATKAADNNYLATTSAAFPVILVKATPTLTRATPANITAGTALAATQLNATAAFNSLPVPGTFTYVPSTGTVLPYGNHQALSVSFAPADSADFNPAAGTVYINVIDITPPTITIAANPSTLWAPNNKPELVTVFGTITDTGSGINPAALACRVVDSYGLDQPAFSVGPLGAGGAYSFTLSLVSSRQGTNKTGRTYTIVVSASDNAGNPASASTVVVVPHDQGQ